LGSEIYLEKKFLTVHECFELILNNRKKLQWARTMKKNPYDSSVRITKNTIWKNDKHLEKKFKKSPLIFQFCEYATGYFYDWHNDYKTKNPDIKRIQTGIILLNDDFKGGELEIKNYGVCNLKIGDCIWFDSKIDHRVLPVTDGLRYTLVTWLLNK